MAELDGVKAFGFVSEGVLDRDLDEVPEIDKAGPEAESDPDGGIADEAATDALTLLLATMTLLLAAITLLLARTLEAATTPLLEATAPLLDAATAPLLEATAPLLEAATAPLLEAITPELLAGIPELLLGTMLEAGTEALRVVVAEKVALEHWWREIRLKPLSATKTNNPVNSGEYVTS